MAVNLSAEIEKARREIKRLKNSLKAGELRAKMFSQYDNFGLWEYDIASDSLIMFKTPFGEYNANAAPIVNYRKDAVSRGAVYAEDLPEFNRFCDAMQRGDSKVSCEIRLVSGSGIVRRQLEGKTVYDSEGKPRKIMGRTVDITEEKQSVGDDRLDPLTGACSPDMLRDIVRQKRAGINRYNSGALLSVGVDRFPDIAAKCGSGYADYVQKSVCGIITEIGSARRDSVVARVRDGEFLMYISYNGANTPDITAKTIIDRVNSFDFNGDAATVSVGISRLRLGKNLDDVYGESSIAMLEARSSGGGCYMRYSPSMNAVPDTLAETYNSASAGHAKVYDLVVRAFCDPKNSSALMKSAFKALGAFSGASTVCFFPLENGKHKRHLMFNASETPSEKCPCVEQTCENTLLPEIFGSEGRVRVFGAGGDNRGFELTNGAVCAECRAIRVNGNIAGYFAVVFSSSFELSDEILQIIGTLQNALEQLYKGRDGRITQRFYSAIISHNRIEGFSIAPESYVTDYVGDNAAGHHNMKSGDVCYQRIHGRSEPCPYCPVLKLEAEGGLSASTAHYDEENRRWQDITASVNENEFGEQRYFISTTDITDCLGKIRMTDTLTGAMTFDTFASEALRLTEEGSGGGYVAVINVAAFRRINEAHGFETGNMILIAAAEILMRCLGNGEPVCRNEGSRFVAIIREPDDGTLESRLRQILNSIQQQVFDRFKIQIHLLAGVCNMDRDGEIGVMGALDRAITAQSTIHEALYFNENQVVFYDGALSEAIRERRYIEENMVGALENGEFKAYYQPKVSIATGEIVGAEALVRWIRADGEIISPGRFVPIFEQNGFITEMDFAIYKSTVTDIAKWLRRGIDVPLISLNVSRFHLGDEHFCEKLTALVDSLDVPHEYIELEITESLLTENIEKLVDTVEWFKNKGFRISVDDFGSGYSSLNLISQLPFDTLKIDGGFFLRKDLSDKNKKVISSVVTLAKSLNLETVSEGVETQNQVDFLRDLGCDMIQGFFYYKPMPAADFEELLISRERQKPAESGLENGA